MCALRAKDHHLVAVVVVTAVTVRAEGAEAAEGGEEVDTDHKSQSQSHPAQGRRSSLITVATDPSLWSQSL